ncbi:MAG: aldehyde dehydrogenase family protein [Parvularculaceae bacterium]
MSANFDKALSKVTFRVDAFIDGRFRPAKSGARMATYSPINGAKLADIASCDATDIDDAVAAARRAFESGVWRNLSPRGRAEKLHAFADRLQANLEELAYLETLDLGKPIKNSLNADVPWTIDTIRYYAEAIDKVNGEVGPSASDVVSLIVREPMGVVGAVTPWNYPLLMASWKFAPALAAGNSVVMKPAEQTSLSLLRVAELSAEAGLPDGVFNVVPGDGPSAGRSLALHMDVDAIAFTGSTEVGKLIMGYAAQSNMKRVSLECGGKSPQIVMADCDKLEEAAEAAAGGVFYDQGQVCTAGTRLLVQREIKDDFLKRVAEIAQSLQPGDPLDPDTTFGSLVDESQMQRVLGYVEKGVAEGARLVCGGRRALLWSPAVAMLSRRCLTVSSIRWPCTGEIFGPVISASAF